MLEVIQHRDHVEVTYKSDGKEVTEQARYAVITTPAAITHRITKNLDPLVHDALGKIQYGHYVSGAFLTNETGRRPWDSVYAYCTPQRSFNIAFNMSNLVRTMESERQPGSSFMVFSPAKLARDLINLPDEKVLEIYRKDLEEVFPGFGSLVVEQSVQKFHLGLAYCFPGRNKLQPLLMRTPRRIYLAGDYLGSWYTETAIQTGLLAGEDINSKLYSDILLPSEHRPLTAEEYEARKALALRSAEDFLTLYRSIPDKTHTTLPQRETFYGDVPLTAEEMYRHTKNVNAYYFGEIGVEVGNEPDILICRRAGFAALERQPRYLHNAVFHGSYDEDWTLRKVLRRFVWHDRIHGRAMWRMACALCGSRRVADPYRFA